MPFRLDMTALDGLLPSARGVQKSGDTRGN